MRHWLSDGGSIVFLTLTMPHSIGDSCHELVDTIGESFSAVFSGRPFRRDRDDFGINHWFRAWDATHGENGWHPHIHAALFVKKALSAADLDALRSSLHSRWSKAISERGHRAPSQAHGIHLELARTSSQLAGYILSVAGDKSGEPLALELTRGDLKKGVGRSPFGLLESFLEMGERKHLALFTEWCRATKGRHFSRWSRGAQAALGLRDPDSEEPGTEEVVASTVVYRPTAEEWHALRATKGALYEVIRQAESGGRAAVTRFVAILRSWYRTRLRSRYKILAPG